MIREWLESLHFGTRFLMLFMIGLFVVQFCLLDRSATYYLLFIPDRILRGEVWRLFSSVLVHGGILHLAMNMLTFSQLGATLETRIGSLSFFYHIAVFAVLTGLLHCVVAACMQLGGRSQPYFHGSLGFSGVLFALLVIDNAVGEPGPRSILGLCVVPSWIYPWTMLLVMQLLMRNASLLGHLAGIVIGYAYHCGILRAIVPSQAAFGEIETRGCCLRDRFGWVGADGIGAGPFRPFAVFQRRFARDDEDEVLPRQAGAFRGQGRTVGGEQPPAEEQQAEEA
jgi:membrane associated rhomboid family serine protease